MWKMKSVEKEVEENKTEIAGKYKQGGKITKKETNNVVHTLVPGWFVCTRKQRGAQRVF